MSRSVPFDAILLGVALFLMVSAANVLTPLLPLLQRDFGIDYTTAGLVVSAFAIARLSLDLPAGFLEHRLGVRRLAVVGVVLGLAGSILATFSPSLETLVGGRVLMGLGASIVSVVILTTLGAIAPPNARAQVLAVYSMGNNTAISVFPAVGGVLGSLAGWRSTMALCGVLSVACGVLLWYVLGRQHRAEAGRAKGAATSDEQPFVLNLRSFLAIATIYFGVVMYMINRHGFRNTTLSLFAHDRIGLDPVAIASGVSLMAIVGVLVAFPGAMIGDRWSRRGVVAVGFLVLAIGDLAFLGANSYVTFLLASFVLGLGDFFSASQTAALSEAVPSRWRTRALSGYRFSVDLGGTIGPVLLAGLLQVAGFETMIVTVAFLLVLASGSALLGAQVTPAKPVQANLATERTR